MTITIQNCTFGAHTSDADRLARLRSDEEALERLVEQHQAWIDHHARELADVRARIADLDPDRSEPDMSVAEFKRRQREGSPVRIVDSVEEYRSDTGHLT